MGVHEFTPDLGVDPKTSRPVFGPEPNPKIAREPIGLKQTSDVQDGRTDILDTALGIMPDHIESYLTPGFSALDDAMKAYWSGIRVPTKDSFRFMRVKIAGGDKSVLIWNDDLQNGRVRLPVASINRGSHEFNPDKFSPPYLAMTRRYTSRRKDRVALLFRPVPFLVDYTMTVWSSWKRDADYILYQILTRFNPLAEFVMYDQHLQGAVQLRFNGSTDASEKEAGFDQHAKVRYEYTMTAEAWLPLPERLVPTILGSVKVMREQSSGEVLSTTLGECGVTYEPRMDLAQAYPLFEVIGESD